MSDENISDVALLSGLMESIENRDDDGFYEYLVALKEANVSQMEVYICLRAMWDYYESVNNQILADRTVHWMEIVSGYVAPQCQVWNEWL